MFMTQNDPSMTFSTLTKLRNRINSEIADRVQKVAFLDTVADKLADLQLEARFYGAFLDFDSLPHQDVIKAIRVIGGKWEKTPSIQEGKVDYTQDFGAYTLRLWAGDPPPNCKVIEYEETLPPLPARTVKRHRLECTSDESKL